MPTKADAASAQIQRKAAVIDDIKQRLESADAAVLTEYRGLTVVDIAILRAALRPAATDYKIFKNTLARRAAREPALEVGFRPEDEHGPSGVADVPPPSAGGDQHMPDGISGAWVTVTDRDAEGLSAVGALGLDHRIEAQRRPDAECVPPAVGEPRPAAGDDAERRGHGRERVEHPDRAVLVEDDRVGVVEAAPGGGDRPLVGSGLNCQLGRRRRTAGVHDVAVRQVPQLEIRRVHSGIVGGPVQVDRRRVPLRGCMAKWPNAVG